MSILGKKWFTWDCCNGSATGGIVDGSSYCLQMKCARTPQSLGALMIVLMTRSLSDYFPRNAGIDLNIRKLTDYDVARRDSFYCVEKYHATLFHSQLPQNQYSRPSHLNKSPIASSQSPRSPEYAHRLVIKHTKASVYTRALPDIGLDAFLVPYIRQCTSIINKRWQSSV